jgi:hypothetical protein
MPITTKVRLIVGLFNLGKNLVDKECLSKGSKVASSPQSLLWKVKFPNPSKKIAKSLDNYSKLLVTCNLTLRSVSSLNNPQNIEINFFEKYRLDMLKIIIIIIGYILNNFITHVTIS